MDETPRIVRTCAGCTACCTVLAVEEIGKKLGEPCPHACKAGCAIYETRPESCREWACLWLYGEGRNMERPDRLGIVLDVAGHGAKDAIGPIAAAREVWPGALRSPAAKEFLAKLARKAPVMLIEGDKRTLTGPPEKLKRIQAAVAAEARGSGK